MSCASGEFKSTPLETDYRRAGVAVIGVTAANKVDAGSNRAVLARELAQLIEETDRFSVVPAQVVARALSADSREDAHSYNKVLSNFAQTGRLNAKDISALMQAKLPVPVAVIARIEKNNVVAGKPVEQDLFDRSGKKLTDRKRVVLSTVREMVLKATMVNLHTGMVVWSRTYQATPRSKSFYVQYSGSSFSGSLAATLANTMANGIKMPDGPLPPSHRLTSRSLMREVARSLPRS